MWLASDQLGAARLVIVTHHAVAAGEQQVLNLAQAPVWGLVRSAQSEHPGRVLLVDAGQDELPDWARHPQRGRAAAGRPRRAAAGPPAGSGPGAAAGQARPLDPGRAVLVTGGTGGLGALVARHLASQHGARLLLLASRRGPAAGSVPSLAAELAAAGAEVRVAACDAADRCQLAGLLASAGQPLGAVVHAAGVIEDATIESLVPGQLERVLRPKVDAALHLDELTAGLGLSAFVLFSSAAGLIGAPGQGNYAAANAFLDALAARRHANGLPATSLAWGLWAEATGITGTLDAAALTRLARTGIGALPTAAGLDLFDQALCLGQPLLAPVLLDHQALRVQAHAGLLPALLHKLIQARPASTGSKAAASLARRLAGAERSQWEQITLDLVRAQVAAVLGHASPKAIDPSRPFKELGFDSLAAVQLRNQLSRVTGLRLPPRWYSIRCRWLACWVMPRLRLSTRAARSRSWGSTRWLERSCATSSAGSACGCPPR